MSTLKKLSRSKVDYYQTYSLFLRNHINKLIIDYSTSRGINEDNFNSDVVREDELFQSLMQTLGGIEEFIEKI